MTTTVISGSLHRVQRGHKKMFATELPPVPRPVHRPARVALMLALAHSIEQMIADRRVRDQAEVARRLGFTRARLTHLLDLTFLAPDLQERVLDLRAVDGLEPLSERGLRMIARVQSWQEQRARWNELRLFGR